MSARRKSEKSRGLIRVVVVFLLLLIALSVLFAGYYVCTRYYNINIQITRKNSDPSDPMETIMGIKFNDTMQDAHEKLGYPLYASTENGGTLLHYDLDWTNLHYDLDWTNQKYYMDTFPIVDLKFSVDNRLTEIMCRQTWTITDKPVKSAMDRSNVIEAYNAFVMVDERIRSFLGEGDYSISGKSYDSQEELYEHLMDFKTEIEYDYFVINNVGRMIMGTLSLGEDDSDYDRALKLTFEIRQY